MIYMAMPARASVLRTGSFNIQPSFPVSEPERPYPLGEETAKPMKIRNSIAACNSLCVGLT